MPEKILQQEYAPTKQEVLDHIKEQFQDHLDVYDLTRKDLEGKKIIDIAAGERLMLQLGAAMEGIGDEIYAVEPRMSKKHETELEKYKQYIPEEVYKDILSRTVPALGQELPFKDETFDLAVSRSGMPIIFKDQPRTRQIFNETLRILKKGGEFRFFPISIVEGEDMEKNLKYKEMVENVLEEMKEQEIIDYEIKLAVDTKVPLEDDEGNLIMKDVKEYAVIVRKK